MRIDDRWSIEQGNECFVVVETRETRNPKDGKPGTSETRTYHPTLGQCAKKIGRTHTLESMLEDDMWQAVIHVYAAVNRLAAAIEEGFKS